MAAEDNPADDRYQLDQCILEIKRLRDQLDLASVALADIAFSTDLTLAACRNKARRAYEKINHQEPK